MILPLLLAMATAEPTATEEPLNDVYMGTLVVNAERPAVVLARCDLGNTLYVLRDAKGRHAVMDLLKAKPSDAPLYGEVIGSYQEEKGVNVLTVSAITGLKRGKDCHLRPVSEAGVGDADFTGHYYLSGVHEVGSELLLRADGRFEWMLSYGAVDNGATGHWARQGKVIVLTADKPEKDRPLFALQQIRPWNEEAETRLLAERRDAQERKVRERCPFFTDDFVATATPLPDSGDRPSPEVLKTRAAEALAKALTARGKVEVLARQVVAQPEPGAQPDTIQSILSDWMMARSAALQAASDAGLPEPEIARPTLPAACTLPPEAAPGKTWIGGRAVFLSDGGDRGLRGVDVAMVLADGHRVTLTTDRRGFAALPNDSQPGAVSALVLSIAGHEQRIDLASPGHGPMEKGIAAITLDVRQLAQPAFDTMRLTIEGGDLIPGEMLRSGRYHRQP
ncbi:hypothetical protein [Novosphingobium rosa]|uniref:hypothetical protein n=1 Tax=Novosphingobium rosa TaxID=76978 RepID=UPI0008340F5E|nr:hypothetical protein [Novosphingobium rosa]